MALCVQALDDEMYGGPHPFSEPESRIVKLIAASSPVRSFVNIHSGEYALYIPWDSHPDYAIDLPVGAALPSHDLCAMCCCTSSLCKASQHFATLPAFCYALDVMLYLSNNVLVMLVHALCKTKCTVLHTPFCKRNSCIASNAVMEVLQFMSQPLFTHIVLPGSITDVVHCRLILRWSWSR